MKRNIKKLFFAWTALVFLLPLQTSAQEGLLQQALGRDSACLVSGSCSVCDALRVIIKIAEWLTGLSALLVMVVLIYGAFLLITSSGESDKIGDGKNAIKAAVIGLVIVMIAWPAVHLLILVMVGESNDDLGKKLKTGWYNSLNAECEKIEKTSQGTSQQVASGPGCCQWQHTVGDVTQFEACAEYDDQSKCLSRSGKSLPWFTGKKCISPGSAREAFGGKEGACQ